MRSLVPDAAISWPVMFLGFVVTAIYYVSASLVFPDDPEDWRDLDGHFEKHRRKVLGGVLLCNVILLGATAILLGIPDPFSVRTIVITWAFFPLTALAIAVRDRRVILACLAMLIALYPLSTIW